MKKLLVTLLLALGCSCAGADNTQPMLNDFAREIPLTLSGDGPLHELPLPMEVYAGVTRSDLGDIALFDGAGELIPFALVRPQAIAPAVEEHRLPLFPVPAMSSRTTGNLALRVHADGQGTSLDLATHPGKELPTTPTVYIVDADGLNRPVRGFDVALTPSARGYLGTLRVETSNDLRQWREQGAGVIASLITGEERLRRNRIEFPETSSRYFRLTLSPSQDAPAITAVTARLAASTPPPSRTFERCFITPVPEEPGCYRVRTGGPMPVDRLRPVLSDDNSLVGITFYSRCDGESPWIERGSGIFYRLRRGNELVESAPLEFAATTDREWLLRVHSPGSGATAGLSLLEIGWQPHRLIFASRGKPPYRLAYGSGRTGVESFRDDGIAATLSTWEKEGIRPLPVRAGESCEAGGAKALRPGIPAATWRRWLLWLALLSGVLLLMRMAWRLTKEISTDGLHKTGTDDRHSMVEEGENEK